MPPMTPERWKYIGNYSKEVFGAEDPHLSGLMDRAVAAGMPHISVPADVGRLLMILTSMTRGQTAVEVGTLAGYSAIWIARGLKADGKLITIEADETHASFAEREIAGANLQATVEVRRGRGLEVLQALVEELPSGSVDLLFIDAQKDEYASYFSLAKPLVAVGGLVVADNVYATGAGWIDEGYGSDELNRLVAQDPDFEAVAVPLRQGILIGRRFR